MKSWTTTASRKRVVSSPAFLMILVGVTVIASMNVRYACTVTTDKASSSSSTAAERELLMTAAAERASASSGLLDDRRRHDNNNNNITEQYVISFSEQQVTEFMNRNNHSKLGTVSWIAGVDGYNQKNLNLWSELTNFYPVVNATEFGHTQADKDKHGSPHMIGCYLAHWYLHRTLLNRPVQLRPELYFVFEDDTACIPDLKTRVLRTARQLPADWDMLYIGGKPFTSFYEIHNDNDNEDNNDGSSKPRRNLHEEICRGTFGKGTSPLAPDGSRNLSVSQPYWKTKYITNTDAYVMNPARMDRIAAVLNPAKITRNLAIDDQLSHAMLDGRLNVYMTTEKLCNSLTHMRMMNFQDMNTATAWGPSFFYISNATDRDSGWHPALESGPGHYIQRQVHIENCSY